MGADWPLVVLSLPFCHLRHGGLVAVIPPAFESIAEGARNDILPHRGRDITGGCSSVRCRRWNVGRYALDLARVR